MGVTLEYRAEGAESWAVAAAYGAVQTSRSTGEERGGWNDSELEWNTEALTEGEYEVRAVASDQPANAAGEVAPA